MLAYVRFYLKKLVQCQALKVILFILAIVSIIILMPKGIEQENEILRWNANVEIWFTSKPNMTELIKPKTKSCIYCMETPNVCKTNNPPLDVVFFITSHSRNFNKRQAIRDTWGSDQLTLKPIFMLANTPDSMLMRKVAIEAANFEDIILEDLLDTYANLTVKTGLVLKNFLQLCPYAKYLMKTDDDTFVNTIMLKQMLKNITGIESALLGHTFEKARSTRNPRNKWYMSVESYDKYYLPTYLSGSGYIITGNLVESLLKASMEEPIIKLEDVYFTGILADKLNIKRVHLDHFFCEDDFCSTRRTATVHKMKVKNFYEEGNSLQIL